MAGKIEGIIVEIGGDATGLKKSLSDVNKSISRTQSNLRDVDKLLKLDPSNTELLAQKQRLLGDAIDQTEDKLKALRQASEKTKASLEAGDLGQDKYDALQREIIRTEQNLEKLKTQAKSTSSPNLNGSNTAMGSVGIGSPIKVSSKRGNVSENTATRIKQTKVFTPNPDPSTRMPRRLRGRLKHKAERPMGNPHMCCNTIVIPYMPPGTIL